MRTLSPKISLTPSLRRRGIIPLFVKAGKNTLLPLAIYILFVVFYLCPLSFAQDLFPGNGAASVDNLTPVDLCPVHLSLSTPSFPVNGNFIAAQPNYSWTGPSTGVAVGLSNYQIQVSSNDSSFASTVVDLLTPVSVNTSLATADGTYLAGYILSEATTYYWRVRAASFAGNYGPWSQNPGFVVDLSSPPTPAMAAVAPADSSNLGNPDPTLDWENVTDTGGSGLNSYEVQLATVSNFSIIAFSSQPVASVARPTGLAGYLYYWRTRASDNAGNTGVWSSTRSFRVALSSPTITNNIPAGGDIVWRNTNNGIYNVDFNDMGGSLLSRVEVKVTSGMGQTGTVFANWTPIITNINASSYAADWSLTSGLWNSLQSWATNYISVRVVDYSSNTYTLDDAFKILKDTVPPTSVNSESGGDLNWLKTARSGGYNVSFADGLSGLAGAKYAVRTSSGGNPPVRISSTAIAGVGGAVYSTPWPVNFNALEDSVTNYVSVEFYDIAGNTGTITDAFIVKKDTTAPSYVNVEAGGDLVWRKAAKAGGYNVDFSDLGSKLAGAKYTVRTSSGGNPPVQISSTAIAGVDGAAYTADWAVDFDSLAGDSTNYVSVELYDVAGNTTTITDAFIVLKDTTPPSYINGEGGGDLVWRKAAKAGGYNVDFSDLGSKLTGGKYAVRTSSGGNPPVQISSTAIAGVGGAAYTADWAVDFDSLAGDSTNYVSVEFYDAAGNTTTITDVFKVLKDTTPPSYVNGEAGGDLNWLKTARSGGYNVNFADGISGLAGAKYAVRTGPNYGGTLKIASTTIADVGGTSYSTPWPVDFNSLEDSATNYVSVELYDIAGNTATITDAFIVKKDTTPPSYANGEAGGDLVWRKAAKAGGYNVDLSDLGSKLAGGKYAVRTSSGGNPPVQISSTAIAGVDGAAYTADWAVDFDSLAGDSTNYVSVEFYDAAGNTTTITDVFKVLKDTTPPSYVNGEAGGDLNWLKTARSGGYNVSFADGVSGLAGAKYAVRTGPNYGGTLKIASTTIAGVGGTAYSTPWTVDFNSLEDSATNYVSVELYDVAGNTTTITDAFIVKKDTTPPSYVNGEGGGDLVWRKAAKAGGYNVDFSDLGSKLAGGKYAVRTSSGGNPPVQISSTAIAGVDGAAYTADWAVDFDSLAADSTNYVSVEFYDTVGNTTTITDVFKVLKDTTPPSGVSAVTAGIGDSTVSITASGSDSGSRIMDYNYEFSLSEAFDGGISSSNFTGNNFTFTGLNDGATYYLRAYARDNAYNLSDPSAVVSTMTSGIVYFTAQSTAPATLLQGTSIAFLIFDVNTNPGRSANLSQVKVAKLGNIPNSDISAVYIYRDDGDGTFGPGDSQIGGEAVVAGTATINITPQLIDNAGKRFFAVYALSASAGVGKTIGARLVSASNLTFTYPFRAVGTFPVDSVSAVVADQANMLNITPSSLTAGVVQAGVLNLPVMKFAMQTDYGISRLDKLLLRLGGTASVNYINAVKVYKDSNLTGVFDGGDTLITSGGDTFSAVERTSTVTFTASDALKTVGSTLSNFFIVLDISAGAQEGYNFVIRISTPSDLTLANPLDTVALSTWPFIADYILDFSSPSVSGFATLSSTGGWLGESQWTRLATGVTARAQAQDSISGLSMSTGAFSVQYSTNAGAAWTVIASTTAGAAPYLAWSGVNGSTEAQTLTAYNLAVVQSTNTQTCGGAVCGATNQVKFGTADSVGNLETAGPYAVLADTTPPSGISAVAAGIGDSTVSVSASANDGVSGIRDYNYELSPSEAFDSGVSSSNFTGNSFTFTGLNDGTTYYLRSYARDNAYNLSDPSAVVSTVTSGIVYFTAQSTAPAWHIQGGAAASLIFDLNANAGRSTLLQQVKVAKLGNIPDSDIAAVYIYRDDGDGTFGPGDSQIGAEAVVSGTATINITPQIIDNSGKRFFAVYALSASAGVGKTIGARLVAASNLTFAYPFRAVGTFPANSTQATVVGEPNILTITPSSLTAGVVQAGVLNLPAVKLLAQTDTGSSRIDRLILRLGGTAPANYISAVKIYQDSNSNNVFDGGDTLITSGLDTFSAGERTSTVTFTASDALRTAGSTPSNFFITLDISGGAQEAYNFSIRISTPSDLTLANPLDTVALSTWPFIADYILDFSSPSVSGFATLSSTGGWLGESQWTRLATGVTARAQAQDIISGLSMSTGAFSVQYSTNAGAAWTVIASTTAGSAPYLAWSGVNGSTEAQTLTAYNLAVVQSTNTQTCGGAVCGATNQFKFTVRDMIGNTRTSSPYAVLADTTPPAGVSAVPAGIGDSAVSVSASASDGASGVRDYNYELSPSEAFDSGVSSSNFTGNSFTFTGLDDGTTYYLRSYARDNVDNLSDPSAAVSTMTSGIVYFTAQSTAPAALLQGTSVAFLIFDVNTNAGRSANLSQVKVAKLGNIPNTDIAAAYIYRDEGDGTFGPGDSQIGGAVVVSGTATINVTPQLIDNAGKRFFVVYKLSASAGVGKTIGARLVAASNLTFTYPFRAVGTFPADSISAIVADGPNILNIVPSNLAPGIAQPGVLNLPVMKFAMQTDQGISRLDKLILRFGGTASANYISAVKIYRDSNLNGVFDGGDTLVTSGGDTFSADERTSTVAFTASDALRTVGSALSYFFITLDMSNGAVEGNNFNIGISTASDFTLGNSSDTVAFSTSSFTSATTTIVLYNAAAINLAATMPAEVSQGISYQVAIATLNVDVGITQLSRIRVNRTGFGSDLDAVVSVYLDSTKDGGPLNTTVDLFLGSASFSGGVATINMTTVTITAGFDSVLFYALNIAPLANPTNTIGISVTNADYLTMPSYTISKTVTPLPFNTGSAPIKATVNKLMLAAVSDITTGSVYEGAANYPMLKLSFSTDRNQAILTSMRVDKIGTLADNMVTALNIFRDEDDSGDYGQGDTLVTQSAGLFSNGSSNLSFTEPQIIGATRTYFVALSVSPNAETGYTIGLQAANTAYFTVTAPNYMSTSAVSYPVAAGPVGVQAYPNTVTISTAGIYSSGVYPGQSNVPIFKLTARADISRAKILSMKFDQAGTSSDSDIAAVKIYYDVNNRGYFDPNSLSNYVQVTPSTVAFGSDGTMGAAFLNISTAAQTITTLPINYFLVVDIAAGAAVGKTVIVRALNSASFTVNAPNSVAVSPLGTSAITIQAPQQTLYASFQNQLSTWVAQGQNTILVSSFTVYASSYAIDMSEIDVMRAGTGYDSDISEIRLYRDSGNGLWGGIGEETLVSTAAFYDNIAPLYVSGSVGQSRKTYYIVANVATSASYGRTFGITVPTPNYIRVNSPHLVSAAAFPFTGSLAVINPTIDTLSITPTDSSPGIRQGDTDKVMGKLVMAANQNSATLISLRLDKNGTLPDADITAVKVWEDNGDGNFSAINDSLSAQSGGFTGGYSSLSFLPAKVIGLAGKTYFITVSVAELATVGATFGITAPAQNFNVAAPDILSVAGSTAVFTTVGTLSDDPDILYVRLTDKASASLYQGTFNNYMGKLEFWTNRDRAVINTMRVGFAGSVSPSDIVVKLYKDINGDGLFNSTYDVLAGSAQVSGDSSSLDFSEGLNLTASTATFFLMMDIAGSAGIGATAGLAFTNETSLTLSGVDTAAPFSGIATTVGTIRDAKIPTPPVLRVYKANGEIFASEAAIYNPYKTRMRFSWESSVMAGDIEQVYYYMGSVQADGNTPGSSWTGGGINRDLWATGLDLTQASSYYLCVRTKNSLGAYYSDIVCRQFMVDALVPQLASASLSVTREQNSLLINWGSASAVPSGVSYYRVEERKADSPLWVQVSATDSRTIIIGDSAMSPSGLPSSYRTSAIISRLPGTYYYRVTPVSGSGLEGTPTEPLRVDLSLSSLEAISDVSAYPNPFDSRKGQTTIHLQLNMSDGAVIKLYDIYGKKVKTLDSAPDTVHDIKWDGTDSNGKKVSKGIYIGVIEAAGQSVKVKIGVIH